MEENQEIIKGDLNPRLERKRTGFYCNISIYHLHRFQIPFLSKLVYLFVYCTYVLALT